MNGAARDGGEPKRLLEDGRMTPRSSFAVGLLRSTRRYDPPAGRKERVRAGLAGTSVSRRAPLGLRVAVAAVVLVGFAALARASLGRWPDWMVHAYRTIVPSSVTDAH